MGQPNLDLKKLFPNPFTGLNQMARQAHQVNVTNGFYEEPVEDGTRIALMHSEVSELLEANRNPNKVPLEVDFAYLMGLEDTAFKVAYKATIKGSEEEEVADIAIRNFDWAAFKGVDLDAHVALKLRYNSLREYKHGKKY